MASVWTEERVGSLKKLWLEGQSAEQIANVLKAGITRNAVAGKVHRLGLSGREQPSGPARTHSPPAPRNRVYTTWAPRKPSTLQPAHALVESNAEPRVQDSPGTASLTTLEDDMCKWPIGDPTSSAFTFCGRKTRNVYCPDHEKVAYQPQAKKGSVSDLARSLRRYI